VRHSYIDEYSSINSYIHNIEPRVKIASTFLFILFVVFTEPSSFSAFALYGVLIGVMILLSKLPVGFIFRRSFAVIPFVIMVAMFMPFIKEGEAAGVYYFGALKLTVSYGGLMVLWNVAVKSYLCILSVILLLGSTRISDLLKALERLRAPSIFIMILSFMYRYIFVLQDELMKMRQAKDSRTVWASKWFHTKALANMVGVLFMRAYERGENVYLAMCSRGFNGQIRTLQDFNLNRMDFCFLLTMAMLLIAIRTIGK
jgi:cobalt/nickel transport system permease protein